MTDVLVDASKLVYRYGPQGEPVLRDAKLTIRRGERILLQGASGGGKSTLAALLTGLQVPDSGLLLMQGLDRGTLGTNWHQLVTSAPQFHENDVLCGTLGFNLLSGGTERPANVRPFCRALHRNAASGPTTPSCGPGRHQRRTNHVRRAAPAP